MNKKALLAVAGVLALAAGVLTYRLAFAGTGRADCPGRMVCPLTGETICKDQCPLGKAAGPKESAPTCCRADQ
jgi:hypothetical protein